MRVRPAMSLPVDGKDLFFVRKTSPSSVAVGDRAFAIDGFLDDRASQVNSVSIAHRSAAVILSAATCFRARHSFLELIPGYWQEDAFHLVGVPMIESALAGFNTSLVCYGQVLTIPWLRFCIFSVPPADACVCVDSYQSGTGKTYTMWGPLAAMFDSRSNRADRGVVPRFFQHLFSQIQGVRPLS